MNKTKLCLSASEVSDRTGLSVSTIRKMTRSDKIPHIRCGRRIIYPVSGIEDWLAQNTIVSSMRGDAVE